MVPSTSVTGTCVKVLQPRQFEITSPEEKCFGSTQSPQYPDPPACSAAQPPVLVSSQGQQLPLELLTSHDIQHRVQAAAYAAHGFKELIGGVEDVGVRWCDLVMDPHEHQSDDHDVVGREGDHKDEQGSGDEPQRLPSGPLGSSLPPASREAFQNTHCHDVKSQHDAERQQEAYSCFDNSYCLDVDEWTLDVVHAHGNIFWSLNGESHK